MSAAVPERLAAASAAEAAPELPGFVPRTGMYACVTSDSKAGEDKSPLTVRTCKRSSNPRLLF